jgi:hypothetical protein
VVALRRERERLLALEHQGIDYVLTHSTTGDLPIDRFARGALNVMGKIGRTVEKLVTGRTPPAGPPAGDSGLQDRDPARRLAAIHCERLKSQDRLRAALRDHGLTVTAKDLTAMLARTTPSHR